MLGSPLRVRLPSRYYSVHMRTNPTTCWAEQGSPEGVISLFSSCLLCCLHSLFIYIHASRRLRQQRPCFGCTASRLTAQPAGVRTSERCRRRSPGWKQQQ
ncbi:hypothetical protein ILYODFUR_020485 [Ilyodon furcidens]|uniref:Uncharacterized protein n=1 Tax=Ilyodon furcidens TaxID=33524 RepID=A0ABV0V5C9_9TELE